MIYKYCRRCGKRLKSEENRIRGYGETCYEKARQEAQGVVPLISPSKEQIQRELKRLRAEEQRAKAEAEQAERARERLEARQTKSQEQSKAGRPPHLEKTLSPTCKKPLLFMPHTATPSPDIY